MTWRSFFCVVVAAITFNMLYNWYDTSSGGALLKQGLVLNLQIDTSLRQVKYQEFTFFTVIGVCGGVLGATYVRGVVGLNALRRRLTKGRPRLKVCEAAALSTIVFLVFFFLFNLHHLVEFRQ